LKIGDVCGVPDSGGNVIAGPISRVLAFTVLFAIGAVVTPARAQIVWNNTGTARCVGYVFAWD
jgi:hypothetical protein